MIVIPDIHGRNFWKDAVKGRENEDIVFLGDYMDPYDYEGITYAKALENFKEIVEFANSHPNVTLLLGNHDCHYLSQSIDRGSRYDFIHAPEIVSVFKSYTGRFLMATERTIDGKRYIFSHAGIGKRWLDNHELLFKDVNWEKINIVDWANNAWEVKDGHFLGVLNDISYRRGGFDDYGSMIWADTMDHYGDKKGEGLFGDYQIFGHTQTTGSPLIFDKFANLDCRRGFILDDYGNILELDRTPAIKVDELRKKIEDK